MAAAHVEHATYIAFARDHFTDALLVHQLQLGVAIAFPQAFLRFQVGHLLGRDGREYAAVLEVALDVVLGYALADDSPAFEGHRAQQFCFARANSAFDHVDVTAVAVDDLATVAAGCTKANLGSFDDGNLEAVLQ
ncbi:hypothetical protein PS631_05049 [Pseudomonas fluorescens]|uniref:Uncharacterized protein n=1 Tax=Pseudomonas fluorescens TaxID=294 RepID=A0A5E6WX55_PSEFL|nr:hypothetical protein PS631_05039 [Pseudomonas fluorescens]VVN33400.1 hypothetical protein PS631_05049 [Pseudomonas fluorescens]